MVLFVLHARNMVLHTNMWQSIRNCALRAKTVLCASNACLRLAYIALTHTQKHTRIGNGFFFAGAAVVLPSLCISMRRINTLYVNKVCTVAKTARSACSCRPSVRRRRSAAHFQRHASHFN